MKHRLEACQQGLCSQLPEGEDFLAALEHEERHDVEDGVEGSCYVLTVLSPSVD